MTRSTNRTLARFSLALFVVFAMVVALAPGISLGQMVPAALQTTESASPSESGSPSESPTGTASPSPTGPAIQFLNPSSHSLVVSTKDDGTNTTYHLVATTRALPANSTVEFKYQEGDTNEVSIGPATQVGVTDTFELHWNPGTLADGTYTLKAILYSGTVELARDEEEVVVNNEDTTVPPPPDPQAETVEITAPANGGPTGFFQPLGAPTAHTVISVTSSAATGTPSLSLGTASVDVYYTKSAPGTEPEWISCGSEAREEEGNRIQCTLDEGDEETPADQPSQVTALAAVAVGEDPAGLIPGSGDAHRVTTYIQVPSSFTLTPANQSPKAAGTCADAISAAALDQNGRPIMGLNVDVHGKGPSDGLLFDDPDDNSSAHQPPDKSHSSPELTRDCEEDAEGAEEQGQHEFAPGNPDIKHVESVDGTADDGSFTFQFFSPDGGITNYAIFGDEDDDDQWCTEEESAMGQVTFTQTASPSPTPSESGSPSGSASPTGGPPASAEPTTLGPELSSCPRPTASPSGTPSDGNRSISLGASKRKVKSGGRVTLSGQITAEDQACENNEVVEITRRFHGTQQFRDFRTTATDANGAYDVRIRVRRNADYQASTPASGECDEAMSSGAVVLAKVKIFRRVNDRTPERGTIVRINGRVAPKHRDTRVVLKYRKGGRWVRFDRDSLNRKSRFAFRVEADWGGKRVFKIRWNAQDADHAANNSKWVRVRSHR